MAGTRNCRPAVVAIALARAAGLRLPSLLSFVHMRAWCGDDASVLSRPAASTCTHQFWACFKRFNSVSGNNLQNRRVLIQLDDELAFYETRSRLGSIATSSQARQLLLGSFAADWPRIATSRQRRVWTSGCLRASYSYLPPVLHTHSLAETSKTPILYYPE